MADFGPAYVASGLGVGLLVGMTGIGGGALMTPILVLVFGVSPKTAVGTDLLFAALTKTAGATVHGMRGSVDWQVFHRLTLGSLPAATLTGLLLYVLGRDAVRIDQLLAHAMGAMLLLTACGLLFRDRLHALGRYLRLTEVDRFKRWQGPATVAAGIVLGVVVTLTSIGAGALGAVFLVYLYPLRLTPARLVGTDIVHAIPLALIAGIGHWLMGSVDWSLLAHLLAGSIPGVLLGSWWANKAPDTWLRPGIAIVLGLSGTKILYS